jgi:hypothetical protein
VGIGGGSAKVERSYHKGGLFMNYVYKVFLTINATSWVIVIFGIKEEWTIAFLPVWAFGTFLLFIPIVLSGISILLTLLLSKDTLENCGKIKEVNNSFLPTYLAYFFVGLGIGKYQHLVFVYLIILIFTYVAQTQYFNPIFLLFGYRFYNAETAKGTKIFLISRKNIRNANEINFTNLRRINDTTFISWREKDESINS